MAERTFVALDLETTGLNPQRDTIIEIGAVRFRGAAVIDRFTTLVNPGRPIPPRIQQLTGITDGDVADAPSLGQVLPELLAFVDREVYGLVAHNASFDMGFLRAAGLNFHRPAFDTQELATILLPGLPSYSLGALCEALDIQLDEAHRAGADALATAQLFMHLLARLDRQPSHLLHLLFERSVESAWPVRFLIEDALAGRRPEPASLPRGIALSPRLRQRWAGTVHRPADSPSGPVKAVESAALAHYFAPDGPLAAQMGPDYETRTGQVQMAQLVADALNTGDHRMIEAGTGIGKTLAYLLPAALWALENDARVVIATHTIPLQDQILHQEIPRLQAILAAAAPHLPALRAAQLKGRANYLCTRRLEAWHTGRVLSPAELRLLAKVLVWAPHTATGDVSELPMYTDEERALWRQIASDSSLCSEERCGVLEQETHGNGLGPHGHVDFYWLARREAESAHLLVVNHALLIADMATGGRLLPPYQHLIVDEAHRLEEAATEQMTVRTGRAELEQVLQALRLPPAMRQALAERQAWRELSYRMEAAGQEALPPLRAFMDRLLRFALAQSGVQTSAAYEQQIALDDSVRAQPQWSQFEIEWELSSQPLREAANLSGELVEALGTAQWWRQEPTASYLDSLRDLHERLTGLITHFDQVLYRPVGGDASTITWLAVSRGGQDAALCAAPLYAGEVVGAELLRPLRSVVLTGATLRTNEGFDFMQERLGCMGVKVNAIPSPFDYRANVLLYLPSDMPPPDRPGYQQTLEQAILAAAQAAGGRTLVLFTSHVHLRKTADGLRGPCEELGLSLLEHGNGGRNRLLQAFRRDARAVLLGAGTFWEGIDLPGELLSCLIIVRLPFAVPTNPLLAARSAVYEDAFNEYVIPDAVIRFRQGFGRLVRRADDRGVVVILDSRIWRRGYGDAFLEALPACTQRHAPVMNLGETIADWLNKERLVF